MSAGKVLIVTGASSGIGRSLAEQAVHAGYNVVAVGRRAQRLDELQASLGIASASLRTLSLDVRAHDASTTIVRTALDAFGRIDVLVNNAGLGASGSLTQQTPTALREQLETHVLAPLALLHASHDALRKTRGQIFFVGSGVARVPITGFGLYPSAKAAIRSVSRIARMELKRDDIAVTYVDPGAVATEFHTRLGYAGPPPWVAASPEHVARCILNAITTRPRVVNAVPWQTFLVSLAEALPLLTDALLERVPSLLGSEPLPASTPPLSPRTPERTSLEATLEPFERRMGKLNLPHAFIHALLIPNAELDSVDDLALRWAGMPNKNERALMREIIEALANTGFLERSSGDRYRVIRGVDASEQSPSR